MANYDLEVSNNSAFSPLEIQMMRENIQGMTDQYNTTMAAYGELQAKADLLEKLANDVRGKDSVAYQNYMNYANTLRQHTDNLATNGLNPQLMRNLLQAKSDYSRMIHPIEEAWQARENEAKRQAAYMQQHPGTMFEKDASKMGIDEWLKNPTYQAQSVDLDNVSKIAGERFTALKNKLQQFVSEAQAGGLNPATATAEDVKKWAKVNGVPWLYQALEKYGANPDDVRALLSGDPRMQDSLLQHIIDETVEQTGFNSWNTNYDHYTDAQNLQNNRNLFNRVRAAAAGEATKSIGNDKFDNYIDNISGDLAYKYAALRQQDRHFNAEMDWKKNQNNPAKTTGTSYTAPRDNYIQTYGVPKEKADKMVINTLLPEQYQNNEGVLKILEKYGLTDYIIDGSVDVKDPKVLELIDKGLKNGEGNISNIKAFWEGYKELGKVAANGVVSGLKAAALPFTYGAYALRGIEAGLRFITSDESIEEAWDNAATKGITGFIDAKPFNADGEKAGLFAEYAHLKSSNSTATVKIDGEDKTLTKTEFSNYLRHKYGDDAVQTVEETYNIIGYDPKEDDKKYDPKFAAAFFRNNAVSNAPDWMVKHITNSSHEAFDNGLLQIIKNGTHNGFSLKRIDEASGGISNVSDEDIAKLESGKNSAIVHHYRDSKGKLHSNISIPLPKDSKGNDDLLTLELPPQTRPAVEKLLDESTHWYDVSTDFKKLKNMSDSEYELLQNEYMNVYINDNDIDSDNPFDQAKYYEDVIRGAKGLAFQMNMGYYKKPFEQMSPQEQDVLIKTFMSQKVSDAKSNTALLTVYSDIRQGDDTSGSSTGKDKNVPITHNGPNSTK